MLKLTPEEKKAHLWRMLNIFIMRGNKVSAQKLNSDWFKIEEDQIDNKGSM